jgi:hypothetical protein
VEGRVREELRVLKFVAASPEAVPALVAAVRDFARRSGTQRAAFRVQGEYTWLYRALLERGGRVRWSDLRMTSTGHGEPPAAGAAWCSATGRSDRRRAAVAGPGAAARQGGPARIFSPADTPGTASSTRLTVSAPSLRGSRRRRVPLALAWAARRPPLRQPAPASSTRRRAAHPVTPS